MAYQSLYRRYRSRRFSEIRGQEHVVRALRNAVREGRVGHAYLFSGPRGTGKTSTARILAKVLNCEHPVDGEPCCECDNCLAVERGQIVDWLQELDAASNNRVDEMRVLLDKVSLGTSGRTKVYILDEVHMLTAGAANALLKTLEEPPGHVVFVLATTDPQKVLPTIRSRTQHFEFHLLPADVLADHVRWVIEDAGLEVGEDAVDHVVRMGGGSARDTLSALDQIAAAGGVGDEGSPVDAVVEALCERDPGAALVAVADATFSGRDPRVLGETLVARLREAFLSTMRSDLGQVAPGDRERVQAWGERLGAAGAVRALEVIGEALVEMRQAPDPRIPLEVALVRLTRVDVDPSPAALAERLERLERAVSTGGPLPAAAPSPPPAPAVAPAVTAVADVPAPAPPGSPASGAREALARRGAPPAGGRPTAPEPAAPAAAARATLGAHRRGAARPVAEPSSPASDERPATAPSAPPTPTPTPAPSAPAEGGGLPDRDELTLAWGDTVLGALPGGARALFKAGRFLESDGRVAVYALPNAVHRDHCEKRRGEVEEALARHFGRPVPLKLVVDTDPEGGGAPAMLEAADEDEDDVVDVHALEDAPDVAVSGVDRLAEAFPGAQLIEED